MIGISKVYAAACLAGAMAIVGGPAASAAVVGEALLTDGDEIATGVFVLPGQANPFGGASLNTQGGIALQVAAFVLGTGNSDVIWGDTTSDNGAVLGGPLPGLEATFQRIGFDDAGTAVFESTTGGTGSGQTQRLSGGSTTNLFAEGDAAAGFTNGQFRFITAAQQTTDGTPFFVASVEDATTTNRIGAGLYSGAVPTPILKTGDSVSGDAGTISDQSFTANSVLKASGDYITAVGLTDSTADVTARTALIVNGAVATEGGNAIVTGGTFTGARTGEVWQGVSNSLAINSSGQWVAAADSNASGDDAYLIVNGVIDTTIVDPAGGAGGDLEAVAINEDGDFAFVFEDDLYINNQLVFATDDPAFEIDVNGTPTVMDRIFALGNNLTLTDRDASGQVIVYFAVSQDDDPGGALGDTKSFVKLAYTVPEPGTVVILAGLGTFVALRRRRLPTA